MASIAIRRKILVTSLPHVLTCRRFGFRTICSGRIGFAPSQSLPSSDYDNHVAGIKVLEKFTEEFEIGSKKITLETGKLARFANGAVLMGMDETKVLSTVASGKGDSLRDFLPLTVDYQEKHFAQGMIPGTFMRREGAPKERELLCGRLIDRPIRPLFPAGFYHEVQVTASVLSSDGKQDPDIMAANATSAALMLSDIPWGGPIGMIRIGRISGKFIVNPSVDELSLSDLNLVYACTKDKTLMIDVQAREISERDLGAALKLAHPEAVKYLEPQIRLASRAGKGKKEYKLSLVSKRTFDKIKDLTEAPIAAVFTDPSYGKFERGEALEKIGQDAKRALEEESDEESLKVLSKTVDTVRKEVVRRRIIAEGYRLDGRSLDEVRPLFCEAGTLPQLHGSSLFSRGDTQVLCTVTLGAPGDAQHLDSLVGPSSKRFMLHYSFPPFCINEVGKRTGLNRREVGHGTLAEKSLLAVLPPEENLPYTVRINSEVMASDGSTSMATVCGGSMALMDAGIPLKDHVAGVSVGLVSDIDPSTGEIKDYRILTDILGLEDHLGDMDFKIAGTRNGITASQLDIKPAGIPLDIICEALEPALKARLQILNHMEQEINAPRAQNDRNSPRIVTLKYSNDALRQLIGPLGSLKRKIEEETGARISVSDGTLTIVAKDQSVLEKVLEKVDFIVGREVEVGGTYKGVVTSIKEYGAFVEFNGGQQGLLHISELSHEPVTRISDVVSIGQKLSLKCIGQDLRGNIKLSLKETQPRKKSTGSVADLSAHIKEVLNVEEPVKYVANDVQEKQSSTEEEDSSESETSDGISSHCMTPSVVIRSAEECDKNDKLNQKLKAKPKRSSPTVSAPKQTTGKRSKSGSKKEIVISDTEIDIGNGPQADFVVGREVEVGKTYKGVVTSIKEYGAFVEFNGGQQGLLHISELSHEPVTRISDVVSIGQKLSLKCVGQDLRGNIKLSLKETQPPRKKSTGSVADSSAHKKEVLNVEEPVKYVADDVQGKQSSDGISSHCMTPSVVIRSAEECDKNDKLNQKLKAKPKRSSPTVSAPKQTTGKRSKSSAHVKEVLNVEEPVKYVADDVQGKQSSDGISSHCMTPSVVIRSAEECDKNDKLNQKLKAKPKRSSPTVSAPKQTTGKRSKSGSKKEIDTENDSDDKQARKYSIAALKTPLVDAKNLKLGMEVIAKVHQVRARGLVLDLGPGVHGMYRFEDGGRREFEIGEELRVKCASFSAKGIPVLSIVQEED